MDQCSVCGMNLPEKYTVCPNCGLTVYDDLLTYRTLTPASPVKVTKAMRTLTEKNAALEKAEREKAALEKAALEKAEQEKAEQEKAALEKKLLEKIKLEKTNQALYAQVGPVPNQNKTRTATVTPSSVSPSDTTQTVQQKRLITIRVWLMVTYCVNAIGEVALGMYMGAKWSAFIYMFLGFFAMFRVGLCKKDKPRWVMYVLLVLEFILMVFMVAVITIILFDDINLPFELVNIVWSVCAGLAGFGTLYFW